MLDAYQRREANRRESLRSYLAVCSANGRDPEPELLELLSWSHVHGADSPMRRDEAAAIEVAAKNLSQRGRAFGVTVKFTPQG